MNTERFGMFNKRWVQLTILAVLLTFTFVFLRTYKLGSSLLFFNDMGRDFLVLDSWLETGKPPLLGPQTSAFSYNQSAWYFYLLFPFYALTHSPYSSVVCLQIVSIVLFLSLIYTYRDNKKLLPVILTSFWLLSIQPQVVIQNRFIWNPSFLPIFLLTVLIIFLDLYNHFSKKTLLAFLLLLAFACGFSYSAVPLAFLLWCCTVWKWKKEWKFILTVCCVVGFLVFMPTMIFELRHNFALTRLALTGQVIEQGGADAWSKTTNLGSYVLGMMSTPWIAPTFLVIVLLFGLGIRKLYRSPSPLRVPSLLLFATWFVLLILVYVLHISVQKHYVFPIITLGIVGITLLPRPFTWVLVGLLSVIWLDPQTLSTYFQPAARSIADMQVCYRSFCAEHPEPLYVSMESGLLNGYHNAPEHQYFLKKAGCQVYSIEESQDKASHMVVVNDSSHFTPGKSGYRELSLFGRYTVGPLVQCTPKLSLQEINKAAVQTESSGTVFAPQ